MSGVVAAVTGAPRAARARTEAEGLPALRQDLRIAPASPSADGSPAWTVHDPAAHRFFRLGWLEFELLSRWVEGLDPASLVAQVAVETPLRPRVAQVEAMVNFLRAQHLLRADSAADTERLRRAADAQRESPLKWLLHHYLFFRVPLVRPGAWLKRTQPRIDLLWSRGFAIATLVAAVTGLLLAAREWDTFTHSLRDTLSPEGLAGFLVALVFAKTLHELGHAFTATRYGLRVPQMGVAFLVMWPMLYTDTGEAWKLADRGRRLRVAGAGIATEFALAAWATLAWCLVDDGNAKSALFFLATTSWVLTLAVNASPFMRFDGYFLLSDALDLPNLHERAGALARAWLRRTLLGWDEPDPEAFPPRLRRGLVAFALTTWLYRLVVFIAIALAVYHFFFKLLGVLLFVVEIGWFIARPVWSEVKVWVERRAEIRGSRRLLGLLLAGALIVLLAWPWRLPVRAEAWMHAERQQLVYSPLPARVAQLREPGPVRAGDLVALLDSPDLRSRAAQSATSAESLSTQLDRSVGRGDGAERRTILAEQLAGAHAELDAQRAELRRLELRAPFDGVLGDRDPQVQPGAWVNATQPIAILHAPDAWVVDALVDQRLIDRIEVGAAARFHRRGRWEAPLPGRVVAIDGSRVQALPHPMLAAEHGGRLASVRQGEGQLVPKDGLYRVRVKLDAPPPGGDAAVALGTAVIEAAPRSLLHDWGTGLVSVLVRESGF
ncbi:MAG: HlyD family efflux transporter periplasmic adaptor subunit [Burkholderiales bacterium]